MSNTTNNRPTEQSPGMSVADIYFILFRHKWKIVSLSVAGLLAAGAIHHLMAPPYQSQAEVLIKYIPAAAQPALVGDSQRFTVLDSRGDSIINAEIQILTSLDLCEEAVTNFGVTNILGQSGADVNPITAAMMVHDGLEAAPAGQGSSVIVVTLKNRNPKIVQPLLHEIIDDYFQRHFQIHSAAGMFDDALTREQAALSVQLNATEQQIADLKNQAGIISFEDAQKNLSDQIAKVRADLFNAQAELAGYQTATASLVNQDSSLKSPTTNAAPAIPSEQMDAYSGLISRLEALRKKKLNYLIQGFTGSNLLVLEVESQIADAEKSRTNLEARYPQIAGVLPASVAVPGGLASPVADSRAQTALLVTLQSKIKALTGQLAQLCLQATNLNNLAPQIAQLEQTRAIQQANLQNLSVSLMKSRIDESLDTGKTPNLKWVQMPSPPGQDWKKTKKRMAMVGFGGIIAGLAWAFLLELYLDRTIKRPFELETRSRLPVFLSIPALGRNGRARLTLPRRRQLAAAAAGNGSAIPARANSSHERNGNWDLISAEKNPELESYLEALRDRLIVDFENKGLTHKPKLVAVTSAGHGAGVSTLAAGLASSFSHTGDGHVLLVDMNYHQGAAQPFYRGKPGLDIALEKETKDTALIQENLYVVSDNMNDKDLPRVLPRRFAALVNKFKASDYDYIIFDLPPVNQISPTSRVAPFMDMVLLVAEAEKTDRDHLSKVREQLVATGASVSAVLNKTRNYIPRFLQSQSHDEK